MPERERPREEEAEDQEHEEEGCVKVKVTVHGKYIGVIKLKRGAKLSDLLDELKKRGYDLSQFMIVLDGRTIQIDPDTGRIKEDPARARNCTLSLLKQVKGGIRL